MTRSILSMTLTAITLLGACEGPLSGLDDELTSLAELKVHIRSEDVRRLPADVQSRLRMGLIWLGVNIPSSWCAAQLSTQLLPAEGDQDEKDPALSSNIAELSQLFELCRNPLGVAPALAGPSVSISAVDDAELISASISFTALPPSEVLIGTPNARVGYASIVIFDDQNENQALDIGLSFPPVFWDRDARGDDDTDEGLKRRFGEEMSPDLLYSASFTSLLNDHQRLVFREGDFVESFFYPLGGCIPDRGFSVVNVEGDFLSANCTSHPIDDPTLLRISEPTLQRQELACVPTEVWRFEPPKEPIDERYKQSCISSLEIAITDPELPCKQLSVISLIDCEPTELDCDRPEWDLRDMPPAWWPCTEEE